MTNQDVERSKPVSWRRALARWRKSLHSQRDVIAAPNKVKLIRDSGLFNPEWYLDRYPDVREAGLDPLDHFISHGGREGRKAGPNFDSRWYMDHYPDVATSGLHPMVHFLLHGQGRQTIKRVGIPGLKAAPEDFQDADEISASPLFDAAWYIQDSGFEINQNGAALHYLKVGAPAGLPAGPNFDGSAYLRAYADVREAGENPLLHYIRHGAAEGRKAFSVADAHLGRGQAVPSRASRPIAQPKIGEHAEPWTQSNLLKSSKVDALATIRGVSIGLLADVFGDRTVPLPDSLRHAADVFCRLRRDTGADFVTARRGRSERVIPVSDHPDRVATPAVIDGWFINDNSVRLRIEAKEADSVVRLIQTTVDGAAILVGEALLPKQKQHLVDASLVNNFQPILIVYAEPSGALTGGDLIAFPSLFRGGAHAGEVAAFRGASASPLSQVSNVLLRDALGWEGAPAFSLGMVHVDLKGATGAERMFRPAVQQWLAEQGVHIEPVQSNAPTQDKSDPVARHLVSALSRLAPQDARSSKTVLTLPCDAIPTLSALLSRRPLGSKVEVGSYIMSDSTTPIPRWLVSMPGVDDGLLVLQPASAPLPYPILSRTGGTSVDKVRRAGALAIRFRDPSQANEPMLTYPVAPDAPGALLVKSLSPARLAQVRIAVVVVASDPMGIGNLLESLARQTLAERLHIVLGTSVSGESRDAIDALMRQLFPGRHTLFDTGSEDPPASAINAAARRGLQHGEMMLFADEHMVLHDVRTLEVLYTLASRPRTASAACVLIRDGGFRQGAHLAFQAGGIFPTHISLQTAPSLAFTAPRTLGAFPLATYPVAGNDFSLMLVPSAVWVELSGLGGTHVSFAGHALDFALRALQAGYGHLCTSAVTATDLGTTSASPLTEIPGADVLEIDEWASALDRMAILRALD